jgi:serine/threonine-protein kinase
MPTTDRNQINVKHLFGQKIDLFLGMALDLPTYEKRVEFIKGQDISNHLKSQIIDMLIYAEEDSDDVSMALISESEGITGKHLIGRLSGKKLNSEFVLEELISLTDNSAVYVASRISSNEDAFRQKVAIKVILPILEKIMGQSAVSHEAQIISQCKHHNIVKVLSSGRIEADSIKFPCLVMEYISGKNLLLHSNTSHLDDRRRLKKYLDICNAVSYLHSRPIIHGDLKPENILIDDTGDVKIVDFTLGVSEQTKSSDYRGMSAEYASQQHLSGFAPTIACDIYSLGVILNHLVNGRVEGGQFIASTGKKMPRISQKGINSIILKATHKNPDLRYNTVYALGYDIKQVLNKSPVIDRQKLPLDIIVNLFYRRPIAMALFCGAIGLITYATIEQSITKAQLEVTVLKLNLEKEATRSVLEKLTSLLSFTDVRHLNGQTIKTEDLLNEAKDITEDHRLPLDFRFELAMKYGSMRLGTGNINGALINFTSAYELAKNWAGSASELSLDNVYQAATKISEAHFINGNYIKVIEIGDKYLPGIIALKEPKKELVPMIKLYFKSYSKATGSSTAILQPLVNNMLEYYERNIRDNTPEEIIEFNYDLANMLYYQFSGNEYSITAKKTDEQINEIRKVLSVAKSALDTSIALAKDIKHFSLSEHYGLASKVDFDLNGDKYLDYGQMAVSEAIKTYQTKEHVAVLKAYLKYYSVAAPYDHQLSYELITQAAELQKKINKKGDSETHIIDVFEASNIYFMGDIQEVASSIDPFLGNFDIFDNYYEGLAIEHAFWNMHNYYGFPNLTQKSLDYLDEYKYNFEPEDGKETTNSIYYKFTYAYLNNLDFEEFTGISPDDALEIIHSESFIGTSLMDLARLYALGGYNKTAFDFIRRSEKFTTFNPTETGRSFQYIDHYSTKAQVHAILKDWETMNVENEKALIGLRSSNAKNKSEYHYMLTHYHTTLYSVYGKDPDYNVAKNNVTKLNEMLKASGMDDSHPLHEEIKQLHEFIFRNL